MPKTVRTISQTTARRLAVAKQRLAGSTPRAGAHELLDVVRALGCLQLDPISVVARSHLLVLWSRVGPYDVSDLDRLLWEERSLFEYWAHAASIVLTEDFPIHHQLMRRYGTGDLPRHHKLRAWLAANEPLRRRIMREIRARGPLRSRDLEPGGARDWESSGWTAGRNVGQMLDYLWTKGQILVARRNGLEKWWDLSERCLPAWTPRERLPQREVTRRAAVRSLRALGVATPQQITRHFTRGRYPGLPEVLSSLERSGEIERVSIRDDGAAWPGTWFVHRDDLATIDAIERGEFEARTTLLSPFDNLICDRARTQTLFDFDFKMEIYVPAAKRRYGYYAMPVLHGDRLIGRIDPALDRKRGVLEVRAVHAEPGAPVDRRTSRAIASAVGELAVFLGARDVAVTAGENPWASGMRGTL